MSDQWSKPLPCCADLPACVLIRSQSRTFVVLYAIIYFARPPLLWVCFTQVCLTGSLDLVFIDTQIRRISSSPLSGIFFTPLLSGAPFQSERWVRLRVFSSPATHCAVPQSKAVREEKENRSNQPFFTLSRPQDPASQALWVVSSGSGARCRPAAVRCHDQGCSYIRAGR